MIVDCAVYQRGERQPGIISTQHAFETCRARGGFVWVGLHEPSAEEFAGIAREFGLHELAVEDALKAHQRPKVEQYGDTLLVVIKTARYVDPDEVIELGQIALFIGRDFVVAVRHGAASSLADVRGRLEGSADLLAHGPAAVLHGILDKVVDDYAPVVDGVDGDIQEVEEAVFSAERTNQAPRIYKLKREVLEFLRAASSLEEPLLNLSRGRVTGISQDGIEAYFRDVHDHLVRVAERLRNQRDLLTSILEANIATISMRQNDDMRRISAWVAIMAVPTMIAGVYGMNFEHMPEINEPWAYPAVLGLMVTVCLALHRAFRRSGWL